MLRLPACNKISRYLPPIVLLLLWVCCSAVYGSNTGDISGHVADAKTGEPLPWTTVLLMDRDRGLSTNDEGYFHFYDVPGGTYLMEVQRIGYEAIQITIDVIANETTYVEVALIQSIIETDEIEILDGRFENRYRTAAGEHIISGVNLRQQLSRTIAETLQDEPGVAQRTLGPATARPVLRGLGGDRLLILEDHGRTGDLSATSSDHAVAIEPMTAGHIELIRGPAALLFGGNTLGGVVNVIRGQIPVTTIESRRWILSSQAESVNRGLSWSGSGEGAVMNNIYYKFDGSIRNAGNLNTPVGVMDNTGIQTYNGSLGISSIQDWGMIGASGNLLDMQYGVPGGAGIADAHPNGVDVEMYRRYFTAKSRIDSLSTFIDRYDAEINYIYYLHKELEKPEGFEHNPIGSESAVLTTNIKMDIQHAPYLFFDQGIFGVWGEFRDHASAGYSHFTPATHELAFAAYLYQQATFNKLNLQGSVRFDHRSVRPEEERESFFIGRIQNRNFRGMSASVMGKYNLTDRYILGASVMRVFRPPGVEELYMEGPHLANFTYEVGNPDLNAERGWGSELFVHLNGEGYHSNLTVFRNEFSHFIFPRDTGQMSFKREDLPEFQFMSKQVLMMGAELYHEQLFLDRVKTRGSINYVRADFIDDYQSFPFIPNTQGPFVPMIPPLNGHLILEYTKSEYSIGMRSRFAASQLRTDQFEEKTDAYFIFGLHGQMQFDSFGGLHALSVSLDNLFNTEYRNHLSRLKQIMPEAGRNLKFLYKIYF